ncbi:hypothetical protein AB0M97_16505 [Streptomyces sp. NPDC051207]|uniref:hypothetical protein n=1 Tax=Streptomyces sp. NPDC051207 TaxID=3154641 RepID=UPI0034382AB0
MGRHPGARRAVLALDIGGTKLAAGVVTEDGTVLSTEICPTRAPYAAASPPRP